MTESAARKRPYKYSIAALLLLMLCVAGALSGYRVGFQHGYTSGALKRRSEELFPLVYPVSDLVKPENRDALTAPNFDSLIETITSTVGVTSWEDVGGPGTISVMEINQTSIINQTLEVHEGIEDLLRKMREAGSVSDTSEQSHRTTPLTGAADSAFLETKVLCGRPVTAAVSHSQGL